MKAKAVRLPEDLLKGIAWVERKERLSKSGEALRRLVRLGLERDLALRYRHGEVSLQELARILGISVRDALEVLWDLGITGNVSTVGMARALGVAAKLAKRKA